jgi:hypothetical protein
MNRLYPHEGEYMIKLDDIEYWNLKRGDEKWPLILAEDSIAYLSQEDIANWIRSK